MGRVTDLPVVLLSHRGPVSFERDESGRRTASRGAGGLVTALTGLVSDLPDAVWVSAASSEEDAAVAAEHEGEAVEVVLDAEPRLLDQDGDAEAAPTARLRLVEVGATVARVNAAHGREGYQPIDLRLADDMAMAVAAYTVCDVLMVNALADGMNLVAKEAVVVNRRDGVLALSENTGAHQELGAFAVTLHPFDIQQQADALFEALTMDRGLRRARREAAAAVVEENDIAKWLHAQLADLGVRPPGAA